MNIRSQGAETSIEFAIDNALERMSLLKGKDHKALNEEYKEWLAFSGKDIDILVVNNIDKS